MQQPFITREAGGSITFWHTKACFIPLLTQLKRRSDRVNKVRQETKGPRDMAGHQDTVLTARCALELRFRGKVRDDTPYTRYLRHSQDVLKTRLGHICQNPECVI